MQVSWRFPRTSGRGLLAHLLVVCFRADVDQVSCDACHASLAVRTARAFLSLGKVFVQFVHGALEGVPIDLRMDESGQSD